MENNTATLAKIIDPTMAAIMIEEIEEGASMSKASMYITTQYLKREDFTKFRQLHGDAATMLHICKIAYGK